MTRRRLTIMGSTGSIGQQAVALLLANGGLEQYQITALSGDQNIALLAEQARQLQPEYVVTADVQKRDALVAALQGEKTKILAGKAALEEVAAIPVDWHLAAIVGAAGLAPTLQAASHARTLALANKESMVCAGALLRALCARAGTKLLPVDSEHSAIFQCLLGEDKAMIDRLILTASGGPFRTKSAEEIYHAPLDSALAHPNWNMGQRITIDSASMFNKALEMIEAHALFDVPEHRIEVLIHPQSIIHSLIGFTDGSLKAQLGPPDMIGPIAFALNWPNRRPTQLQRLDFSQFGQFDFAPADEVRFHALALAREVMRAGGLMGAVFNAAKEAALDAYIDGKIPFGKMSELVDSALNELTSFAAQRMDGLAEIHHADQQARQYVADKIANQ